MQLLPQNSAEHLPFLVLYVYLVMREPYQVNEVVRIPLIEYLVLFIMYWIYLASAWIISRIHPLTLNKVGGGD